MTEVRASAAVSHLPPQKAAVSLAAAMVVQVAAVPDLPQRPPTPESSPAPERGAMLLLVAC